MWGQQFKNTYRCVEDSHGKLRFTSGMMWNTFEHYLHTMTILKRFAYRFNGIEDESILKIVKKENTFLSVDEMNTMCQFMNVVEQKYNEEYNAIELPSSAQFTYDEHRIISQNSEISVAQMTSNGALAQKIGSSQGIILIKMWQVPFVPVQMMMEKIVNEPVIVPDDGMRQDVNDLLAEVLSEGLTLNGVPGEILLP